MEMSREALLGQMRDEGFGPVLVNRIGELLDVFNGNVPQFCAATRGQLDAAYGKGHPGTKGLGTKTYAAFDRFVQLWKLGRMEARQVAKATVDEQKRREAEKASLQKELLDRDVEFDALTSAMAALSTLGMQKCSLGRLLDMYGLAKDSRPSP